MADIEIEDVVVPMDAETRRRLVALAREVGRHPRDCAAALFRDLMSDGEFATNAAIVGTLN